MLSARRSRTSPSFACFSLRRNAIPDNNKHPNTHDTRVRARWDTTKKAATSVLAEAKENKILSYKEIFLLHEQTTLSGVSERRLSYW